jgi:hypothetical protein
MNADLMLANVEGHQLGGPPVCVSNRPPKAPCDCKAGCMQTDQIIACLDLIVVAEAQDRACAGAMIGCR